MQNILDAWFVQGMIKATSDAWLKGWDERNGGNLTLRLDDADIAPFSADFKESTQFKQCTLLVRCYQNSHLKGAFLPASPAPNARKRPLLSRPRHFRALACNLLPCEAGKLGRLSAPGNTLFPGQRPTAL